MAEGDVLEEPLNLVVLLARVAFDHLVEVRVDHVEVGDLLLSHVIAVSVVLAVGDASDAHLTEDHLVLGESPSLVAEDVRHLAELLSQRGTVDFSSHKLRYGVHLSIPLDELGLSIPHNVHAYKKS